MTTIRWSWDPYQNELVFRDTDGKETRHTMAVVLQLDPRATPKAFAKCLPNVATRLVLP